MNVFKYSSLIKYSAGTSIEAAVVRLRGGVKRQNPLSALAAYVPKTTLFGEVSSYSVVLHCTRPFFWSPFKPYFYGKFVEKDGQVVLQGAFVMSEFAKGIVFILFVILGAVEGVAMFGNPDYSHSSLSFPPTLAAPAMALALIGLMLLSKWIFKSDVKWISDEIEKSLRNHPKST